MADSNWRCWVGTFEIRTNDQLPAKDREKLGRLNSLFPFLVQVGRAELKTPPREAFDMAVLRLLKTKLPKPTPWGKKRRLELELQTGDGRQAELDEREMWRRLAEPDKQKPIPLEDCADIAESAVVISN